MGDRGRIALLDRRSDGEGGAFETTGRWARSKALDAYGGRKSKLGSMTISTKERCGRKDPEWRVAEHLEASSRLRIDASASEQQPRGAIQSQKRPTGPLNLSVEASTAMNDRNPSEGSPLSSVISTLGWGRAKPDGRHGYEGHLSGVRCRRTRGQVEMKEKTRKRAWRPCKRRNSGGNVS